MVKICCLVSGGGGNMKFLYLVREMGLIGTFDLSVIADRECAALSFAQEHQLECALVAYNREENDSLRHLLDEMAPDIIITTWAKILDEEVVCKYAGKMINLHYSLLPAFAGEMGTAPIEKAYRHNCQYIGATCHYVEEEVDMGRIISQCIIKTDISQQQAISMVFRKGCLILLNGILIVTGESLTGEEKEESMVYSPSLRFSEQYFDEDFWSDLSAL